MLDGHRYGRSTGRVSCKSTELNNNNYYYYLLYFTAMAGCRPSRSAVDADSVHVAGREADEADEGDGVRRDGHQRRGGDVVGVSQAASEAEARVPSDHATDG